MPQSDPDVFGLRHLRLKQGEAGFAAAVHERLPPPRVPPMARMPPSPTIVRVIPPRIAGRRSDTDRSHLDDPAGRHHRGLRRCDQAARLRYGQSGKGQRKRGSRLHPSHVHFVTPPGPVVRRAAWRTALLLPTHRALAGTVHTHVPCGRQSCVCSLGACSG